MSMFEPITLKWKGVDYVVKPDAVMEAISRIEQHVTMEELNAGLTGKGIKRVDLARAFASVLRYAGATVIDEEIYAGMFKTNSGNTVISAVMTLLAMMVPPSVVAEFDKESAVAGKKENRRARRAAASSSKPRTKRPSSDGESPPPTSGG